MKRIHWQVGENVKMPVCVVRPGAAAFAMTRDRDKVTCKSCLNYMEKHRL